MTVVKTTPKQQEIIAKIEDQIVAIKPTIKHKVVIDIRNSLIELATTTE